MWRKFSTYAGDVVRPSQNKRDDEAAEKFLLEEGFPLLAAYRNIHDAKLRRQFRQLIEESPRQQSARR